MTLNGCCRFTGMPTQNGAVRVDNETTRVRPDSLLGEFTKASESQISETNLDPARFVQQTVVPNHAVWIIEVIHVCGSYAGPF